jgi:hypothetical protein
MTHQTQAPEPSLPRPSSVSARWRHADYATYWDDNERRFPRGFDAKDGQLLHNGRPVCDLFAVVGLHFSHRERSLNSPSLIVAVGGIEVSIRYTDIIAHSVSAQSSAWDITCQLTEAGLRVEYDKAAPTSIREFLMGFLALGLWHIE